MKYLLKVPESLLLIFGVFLGSREGYVCCSPAPAPKITNSDAGKQVNIIKYLTNGVGVDNK